MYPLQNRYSYLLSLVFLLALVAGQTHSLRLFRAVCPSSKDGDGGGGDGYIMLQDDVYSSSSNSVLVSFDCCTSTATLARHPQVIQIATSHVCNNNAANDGPNLDRYWECHDDDDDSNLTLSCSIDIDKVPCYQQFVYTSIHDLGGAYLGYTRTCHAAGTKTTTTTSIYYNSFVTAGSGCTKDELSDLLNAFLPSDCTISNVTRVENTADNSLDGKTSDSSSSSGRNGGNSTGGNNAAATGLAIGLALAPFLAIAGALAIVGIVVISFVVVRYRSLSSSSSPASDINHGSTSNMIATRDTLVEPVTIAYPN